MKYKATQKLLNAIAKGEFEVDKKTATTYFVRMYSCLIDINKDWTLELIIDEGAIKKNPDYFEEIKE